MYYLQSRYYDSKICRFINADVYISTGYGVLGCNMFAYCNNNPVCYSDHEGKNFSYTCDYDEGYNFNGWLLEGRGAGGTNCGGSYFGLGTAYHNYAVYSNTAACDAYLGGYYYGGGGYVGGYTAQFVTGKVTVTDSMAVNKLSPNNVSYNLNGAKNANYVSKRGWDQIKINKAISNEVKGTSINRANDAPCVVYRYPGTTNQYVVVESGTRGIVQLSNFYDEGWIPDSSIIWLP